MDIMWLCNSLGGKYFFPVNRHVLKTSKHLKRFRKRWVFFEPNQSDLLYPTRLPYEESSVFSAINFERPDLSIHEKFKGSRPRIIVLGPGDLLYVPSKWWHYVSCVDDTKAACISVNCWLNLPTDNRNHLEEAIVRFLATALIPIYEPTDQNWINSRESPNPEEALKGLKESLNLLRDEFKEKPKESKDKEEETLTLEAEDSVTQVSELTFEQLAKELNWPLESSILQEETRATAGGQPPENKKAKKSPLFDDDNEPGQGWLDIEDSLTSCTTNQQRHHEANLERVAVDLVLSGDVIKSIANKFAALYSSLPG